MSGFYTKKVYRKHFKLFENYCIWLAHLWSDEKKKEWNRGDRQMARTDVPLARRVEMEEAMRKQQLKLDHIMHLKRLLVEGWEGFEENMMI